MIAALPRMQHGWSRLQTEQTAFRIAQSFRAARALAIAQGLPIHWTWNADTHVVQLLTEQPDGSLVKVPGRLGHVNIPAKSVPVAVLQHNQPVDTVHFLPNGTSDTADVLLGAPAAPVFTIALDGSTGHVAVR